MVVRALTSSLIFMVPISAAIAEPVLPARMIAVMSGPSSLKTAKATTTTSIDSTKAERTPRAKVEERLKQAPFKEIVTTNTIPLPVHKQLPNLRVLSVAPLLGEVIRRAHQGRSVGQMFNE